MTKAFFIRYAEEIVTFRHVIKFRTEIDANKLHQDKDRMSLIFNPHNPFKTNEFVDNEFVERAAAAWVSQMSVDYRYAGKELLPITTPHFSSLSNSA